LIKRKLRVIVWKNKFEMMVAMDRKGRIRTGTGSGKQAESKER